MKEQLKKKQAIEKQTVAYSEFDLDDALAIEPALVAEIKSKGMVHRWINGAKFKANFGFDSRRWVPYKRESQGNSAFGFTDSEGFTRRGDLILAVRSEGINAAHKAKIAHKNSNLAANQNKRAADEIRQQMVDANIKSAKISEGYDEN